MTALTPAIRTTIRRVAGLRAYDSRPIKIVAGLVEPREVGNSYYHTTPSGKTIVRHPNAYGWRTLYHASTRAVEVGVEWLAARYPDVAAQLNLGAGI